MFFFFALLYLLRDNKTCDRARHGPPRLSGSRELLLLYCARIIRRLPSLKSKRRFCDPNLPGGAETVRYHRRRIICVLNTREKENHLIIVWNNH